MTANELREQLRVLRNEIHDRLRSVVDGATLAQRTSVRSDRLCDLLDNIDNDLQAVIELVKKAREVAS